DDFVGLWTQEDRPAMLDRLTAAVEECAGFIAGVTAHSADQATVELELLVLPLRNRDPRQNRLLGVLAPIVPPYWPGVKAIESMTCGTVRHLGADSRFVMAPRLVPGDDNNRTRRGFIVYTGGRS